MSYKNQNFCFISAIDSCPRQSKIRINLSLTDSFINCTKTKISTFSRPQNLNAVTIQGQIVINSAQAIYSHTLLFESKTNETIQFLQVNISIILQNVMNFQLISVLDLKLTNSLIQIDIKASEIQASFVTVTPSEQQIVIKQAQFLGLVQINNSYFGLIFVNQQNSTIKVENSFANLIFQGERLIASCDYLYYNDGNANNSDIKLVNNCTNDYARMDLKTAKGHCISKKSESQNVFCFSCFENYEGETCQSCKSGAVMIGNGCFRTFSNPGSDECYENETKIFCNKCKTGYQGQDCTICTEDYTLINGSCKHKCETCRGTCTDEGERILCASCEVGYSTVSNCKQCESGYEMIYGDCVAQKQCAFESYIKKDVQILGAKYLGYYFESDEDCTQINIKGDVEDNLSIKNVVFSYTNPNSLAKSIKNKAIQGQISIHMANANVSWSGLSAGQVLNINNVEVQVDLQLQCMSASVSGLVFRVEMDERSGLTVISNVELRLSANISTSELEIGGLIRQSHSTGSQKLIIQNVDLRNNLTSPAPKFTMGGLVFEQENGDSDIQNATIHNQVTGNDISYSSAISSIFNGHTLIDTLTVSDSLKINSVSGGGAINIVNRSTVFISNFSIIINVTKMNVMGGVIMQAIDSKVRVKLGSVAMASLNFLLINQMNGGELDYESVFGRSRQAYECVGACVVNGKQREAGVA